MGDVTAVNMDVVTDKSGHSFIGMAVSVCTTPAAPSPLPIPYPVQGTSGEGVACECLRSKVNGTKWVVVGSVFKACHGNEAGTLKEVVSLNTGGPDFPAMGAPTVLGEKGMAAITGSPGFLNKGVTAGGGGGGGDAGGAGGSSGAGGGGGGGGGGGNKKDPSGKGGSGGGGSGSGSSLKGVSAKEKALAESPGNSKEQIAARKKVAKRFYKQKGQKYDPTLNGGKGGMRNHTAAEARQEMKGIDFNKPVKTGPPPPCPTPQGQWQRPGGRQGQYYADDGTKPTNLGIHDKATNPNTGATESKVSKNYDMDPKTPYMESTAAPVKDTWSRPGHQHGTDGGATQRYVPNQSGAKEVP